MAYGLRYTKIQYMKITVIVPIYNVEQYIIDCLNSVASQTYEGDIECLLVDDCGKDNSMALVDSFVESYNGRVQFRILHHEHNRGLSAARNTGMDAATGDYLYFLDSDDEITPDCLSELTNATIEGAYDMVIGDMDIRGNDKLIAPLTLKLENDEVLRQPAIRHTFRKKWNMMAQNKLYRTDFIKENRLQFKEGLIHEDELWSFETSCLLNSLKAVKHPTYIYKIRGGSITSAGKKQVKMEHLTEVVKEMCCFVRERKIPYDRDIHQRIQFFYSNVLGGALLMSNYKERYRELKPYTKLSFSQYLKVDGNSIVGLLRDSHYFLPTTIGAWWKKMLFGLFCYAEKTIHGKN